MYPYRLRFWCWAIFVYVTDMDVGLISINSGGMDAIRFSCNNTDSEDVSFVRAGVTVFVRSLVGAFVTFRTVGPNCCWNKAWLYASVIDCSDARVMPSITPPLVTSRSKAVRPLGSTRVWFWAWVYTMGSGLVFRTVPVDCGDRCGLCCVSN